MKKKPSMPKGPGTKGDGMKDAMRSQAGKPSKMANVSAAKKKER